MPSARFRISLDLTELERFVLTLVAGGEQYEIAARLTLNPFIVKW